MDINNDVVPVVLSGFKSLARSFKLASPVGYSGRAEHERNLSMHLGAAFMRKGFAAFAEAPLHREKQMEGKRREMIDLLCVSPEKAAVVAMESKMAFKRADKADEMLADARRVRKYLDAYRPAKQHGETYEVRHRFGIIAALAWDDEVVQWWNGTREEKPTKSKAWDDLVRVVGTAQTAHWRSYPLWKASKSVSARHALVAVFRR